MNKFKSFFNKETGKEIKTKDKTIVEILVQIAGEIYSQNQTISPETLARIAADTYIKTELEQLNNKIDNSFVYAVEEIGQKFPQKINNPNTDEESKNGK